ncbi:MAG: hypothetical protein JO125_17120 [Chloroflexi bacterium]|nr:hypothetical protein [Chloroflexota bacterium]
MQKVLHTPAALARRVIVALLFIVVVGAVAGKAASLPTYAHNTHASLLHSYIDVNRPVLAFYYAWYNRSDWCLCRMPDLPTTQYDSSDDNSIDQQIHQAANAGITGFIHSWWGPGDQTDTNFVKLLNHAALLSNHYFASTLYFESEAPALQGEGNIVNGLRYIISHYSNDSHFLHWQGKPVLFFWKPLGQGRTLSEWASIRQQVDPGNQMIWLAEGVDVNLLNVFDGIHLFSAGYWGLLNGSMTAVDQGFRAEVDAYNSAFGTHKIWAAGVMPGYDDTHIAGRPNTFKVPRNNGTTYHISWDAAIASNPEMITITSFNEWFEGSMIEPSVTYHTTYLDITRTYAQYWHG